MDKFKVSIIIPAYNEAESIGQIVSELRILYPEYELMVVNDGSTDKTKEIAESAGALVISHPVNIGNGTAVRTGILNATGDYLVMMDADGQHPPAEVQKLVPELIDYDMVVAQRVAIHKLSPVRNFGNWMLIKIANYLSGKKIPDLTSGFRAFKRARVLEFVHLFPVSYSYPTTITLLMFKYGYPVKYIPMDSIRKREQGQSKIRPLVHGIQFIFIIVRIIMLIDPLKVFLPLSTFFILFGIFMMIFQLLLRGGIHGSTIVSIVVGVFILGFGLLADQIAHIRRELGTLLINKQKENR